LPGAEPFQCDVSNDAEIDQVFAPNQREVREAGCAGACHRFRSAGGSKEPFFCRRRGRVPDAHDVSVYSLIALSRGAAPLMTEGGSIITLTYYGAEKVVAALQGDGCGEGVAGGDGAVSGVGSGQAECAGECDFGGADQDAGGARHWGAGDMLKYHEETVAAASQHGADGGGEDGGLLASDLSSGVTGETIYVDSGYNIVGF